ncbi:MAG: hypothetical protein ABL951_05645 [Alphaproteobacteria bacterium]
MPSINQPKIKQHAVSMGQGNHLEGASAVRLLAEALSDIQLQEAPATATGTATLTAAQIKTRLISATPAAAATYTLPTGTLFDAAFPAWAVNECFDFSIQNLATNAAFIITVAAGTGFTVVGQMRIDANAGTAQAVGRFRARKTAANTFILYRIA